MLLLGQGVSHRIAYQMEGGGRELHAPLGTMTPDASMIHQSVTLIDILSLQDIRFLEEHPALLIHHLPGIRR